MNEPIERRPRPWSKSGRRGDAGGRLTCGHDQPCRPNGRFGGAAPLHVIRSATRDPRATRARGSARSHEAAAPRPPQDCVWLHGHAPRATQLATRDLALLERAEARGALQRAAVTATTPSWAPPRSDARPAAGSGGWRGCQRMNQFGGRRAGLGACCGSSGSSSAASAAKEERSSSRASSSSSTRRHGALRSGFAPGCVSSCTF